MMKKAILVGFGVIVGLVALTSWSFAGDYHYGVDLVCSDCHVMHYSQQHGYNPDGGGIFTPMAGGPHEYLLRNDVNDLCLSCHNGSSSAPDVFQSHSNGYIRQAGALNEVGGIPPYEEASGHTLGSTDVAPGGTFANAAGLNCADCHAVHGRTSLPAPGGYRNLRSASAVEISYSRGDVDGPNPLTKWVHEDGSGGANGTHYGVGAITFNEPDQTKSQYAQYCKACHTDFHGDVGGAEIGGVGTPPIEFHRHPASTANIGAVGGGHSSLTRFAGKVNQVQVLSAAGKKAGTYTASDTDLSPSCMSCHKGHGNQNAFGLIYMLGTGTITEQGDAGADARNMCRQCHGMGGSSTTW